MGDATAWAGRRRFAPVLLYALMVVGAIAAFLAIRAVGESLPPATGAAPSPAPDGAEVRRHGDLRHVLLALVAVIVAGQLGARLLARLRQPPVIGEVLAGIALGPSLLGAIAPNVGAALLPPATAPYLATVAQLGVILYMFTVGLHLDASVLRQRGHAAIAISHASIVAPLVLGAALALGLYSTMAPAGIAFTPFALFLGASLSVTAFPVLARILTDRGMAQTELGAIALASAAAGDVTAWCLLALVVGVAQAQVEGAAFVIAMTLLYMAAMVLVVRPLLARLAPRVEQRGNFKAVTSLVFAALLLSAWVTEAIGIHALFGAFLLGLVIPHDSRIARELPGRFEDLVTIVLLPAFFAVTGMQTQVGLIAGWQDWLTCAAIVAVATAGKFGGTAVAARVAGRSRRDAAALGALMNTRGLMELIVLNLGLDLGVLSPRLFAMMVVMALATTLATAPLLDWLGVGRPADPAPLN